MMLDDSLVEAAALDVLGFYNIPGGWQTGGFRTALIEAWTKADPDNRRRLALGFPELAFVIDQFTYRENTEAVQRLARGESYKSLTPQRFEPR